MQIFGVALSQTIYLFILMALGYILTKFKLVPENANTALSKLESFLFIPALMLGTFAKNFTLEKLSGAWKILVCSLILEIIIIPIAIFLARLIYKDDYLRNIATYGLSFANFGFMGNAVMLALYPDIFFEYTIFVIPLWILLMAWAFPTLLVPKAERKKGVLARLKSFVNPMFICMLVGIIIGLTRITLPTPVMNAVNVLGDSMSPIAMVLTGITLGKCNLLMLIKRVRTWITSIVRLVLFPLVFLLVFYLLPRGEFISDTFIICAMASLSMPLGLNTIVIPTAYGMDTTDASSMALVSHTLSVITLPLMFMLIQLVLL